MNIAIDISPLSTGHSGRGVGVYTRLLVDALQRYASGHTYMMVTTRQQIPQEADVVHYPYFDPYFLTLPLIKNKPVVVTVHDVIPLVFPDKFPSGMKGKIKWTIQKQSLRMAKRIITDSDTSREDIARFTGISTNRIDRIYLGPSVSSGTHCPDSEFLDFRKKYSVQKKYFLYVGDVNWNKNIDGLLRAFLLLSKKNTDMSLLLIGKAFTEASLSETSQIKEFIRSNQLMNRVIMPGFIEDALLSKIYASAICLVSPSHYEGFGFPVIDAMYNACPAVVADTSSLSEISGPSMRIHSESIESIAGGMGAMLGMKTSDRNMLINEGLEWAKQFTWEKTAKQTIQAYEKAIE